VRVVTLTQMRNIVSDSVAEDRRDLHFMRGCAGHISMYMYCYFSSQKLLGLCLKWEYLLIPVCIKALKAAVSLLWLVRYLSGPLYRLMHEGHEYKNQAVAKR
jgi:hypothetical protein